MSIESNIKFDFARASLYVALWARGKGKKTLLDIVKLVRPCKCMKSRNNKTIETKENTLYLFVCVMTVMDRGMCVSNVNTELFQEIILMRFTMNHI